VGVVQEKAKGGATHGKATNATRPQNVAFDSLKPSSNIKSVNLSSSYAAKTSGQVPVSPSSVRNGISGASSIPQGSSSRDGMVSAETQGGGVPPSIIEALGKRAASGSGKGPVTLNSPSASKLPPSSPENNQRVVGQEQGMHQAHVGLRVRLAPGVRGNGVNGEKGEGSVQWVSKAGDVCHVRWDDAGRFDYSYCCGHNGFYDLEVAGAPAQEVMPSGGSGAPPAASSKADAWNVQDVQEFVESLRSRFGAKCNSYKLTFQNEDIDGRALLALKEEDLKELGLSLGHRKVLCLELAKLASEGDADTPEGRGGVAASSEPAFTGVITERGAPETGGGPSDHEIAAVDDDAETRSLRASLRAAPSLSSPYGVADAGNVSPTAEIALDPGKDFEGPGQASEAHVSLFKQKMERLRREQHEE